MAKRRANMLEAFQASAEREAGEPRPGGGAPASQPVPPPIPEAPPAARPARGHVPDPGEVGLTLPIGAVPFLLLELVLLVLVFLMGYVTGSNRAGVGAPGPGEGSGTVEAGTSGPYRLDRPERHSSPGPVLPAREDPAAPEDREAVRGREATAADAAFLDRANKYTVTVFSADDNEFGEERAWAAYDHLASLGFEPVTPRRWKGLIILFVGAAPTTSELEAVRQRVREVVAADGRGRAFPDAYLDNIDKYR